jgi:hypothetical protein
MSDLDATYQRRRADQVAWGVTLATRFCRALEKMPEAIGYLPAPSNGSGESKDNWTPSTLRRAIEVNIARCAETVNHEALKIYREHGVGLVIFERYDSFLENQELYSPHARDILNRGTVFPNPLEAVGTLISGYSRSDLYEAACITEADFDETLSVLMIMGGNHYKNDPQYVSKMFRDMGFLFMNLNNSRRLSYASDKFLAEGGISLCRDYDSDLSFDDSVLKIIKKIRNMDFNPETQNVMLPFALESEVKAGVRDFDPVIVFQSFMNALSRGQDKVVSWLGENTNLRAIFQRMHELYPINKDPNAIILGNQKRFTPLMLLRAIDESKTAKVEPARIPALFNACMSAGMDTLINDKGHLFTLISKYERKGCLDLDKLEEFNDELGKHTEVLNLTAAMKLCKGHVLKANPAALARIKQMLTDDKVNAIAGADEATIQRLFTDPTSESYRIKLGLSMGDAFAYKGKTTQSLQFRAESFSKDLGL